MKRINLLMKFTNEVFCLYTIVSLFERLSPPIHPLSTNASSE